MGLMTTDARAPPIIDFGPFYASDAAAKTRLIDQIRAACLKNGFFQITNHGISSDLQRAIFSQCEKVFALPLEEKMKLSNKQNPITNRGYEALRSQNFEKRGQGDLKESYFLGPELPAHHPAVVQGTLNMGPNLYPTALEDPEAFKDVTTRYLDAVLALARDLLCCIALTLGLESSWFDEFCREPIATLRLLHYPPQAPDSDSLERGIGAHTDFGAITLLLQDSTGGLQVLSDDSNPPAWVDVDPVPGALVVNLGNMMMRWSNDRYISNLHRVINKSGKERYSVPFFFNGNAAYRVDCLPGLEGPRKKYPDAVRVEDYLRGRYVDTYGGGSGDKGEATGGAVGDPRAEGIPA